MCVRALAAELGGVCCLVWAGALSFEDALKVGYGVSLSVYVRACAGAEPGGACCLHTVVWAGALKFADAHGVKATRI